MFLVQIKQQVLLFSVKIQLLHMLNITTRTWLTKATEFTIFKDEAGSSTIFFGKVYRARPCMKSMRWRSSSTSERWKSIIVCHIQGLVITASLLSKKDSEHSLKLSFDLRYLFLQLLLFIKFLHTHFVEVSTLFELGEKCGILLETSSRL